MKGETIFEHRGRRFRAYFGKNGNLHVAPIEQPTELATIGGQITARECLLALKAYRRRLDKRAGHA